MYTKIFDKCGKAGLGNLTRYDRSRSKRNLTRYGGVILCMTGSDIIIILWYDVVHATSPGCTIDKPRLGFSNWKMDSIAVWSKYSLTTQKQRSDGCGSERGIDCEYRRRSLDHDESTFINVAMRVGSQNWPCFRCGVDKFGGESTG